MWRRLHDDPGMDHGPGPPCSWPRPMNPCGKRIPLPPPAAAAVPTRKRRRENSCQPPSVRRPVPCLADAAGTLARQMWPGSSMSWSFRFSFAEPRRRHDLPDCSIRMRHDTAAQPLHGMECSRHPSMGRSCRWPLHAANGDGADAQPPLTCTEQGRTARRRSHTLYPSGPPARDGLKAACRLPARHGLAICELCHTSAGAVLF